jgi:hypothetical protein
MVLSNLLDGEPSYNGPLLGSSESMWGGTPTLRKKLKHETII